MYITIDGPDHCGKTTQIKTIKQVALDGGIKEDNILEVREPGGTSNGEKIRALFLNTIELGGLENPTPVTELLLVAAARYELLNTVIKPFIEEKKQQGLSNNEWLIISDRSLLSTLAYQYPGLLTKQAPNSQWMSLFKAIHDDILKADFAFVLNCSYGSTVQRRGTEVLDRMESVGQKKIEDTIANFKYIAESKEDCIYYGGHVIDINGDLDLDTVTDQVYLKTANVFGFELCGECGNVFQEDKVHRGYCTCEICGDCERHYEECICPE